MDHATFRAAVLRNLEPDWASLARFSKSGGMPFLVNLQALSSSPAFQLCSRAALLHNSVAPTALELADGNWRSAAHTLVQGVSASAAALTASFDSLIGPARNTPSTRAKNWDMWSTAVTWGVARGTAHLLLPMKTSTLKALTMDMLGLGTPRSVILATWSAVQNRHRAAGLRTPIDGPGEFSAWTRTLASLQGAPRPLLFPIHKTMVRRLLAWRPTGILDNRDRLATCLATVACLRVAELISLRACNILFNFHCAYGIPGYDGTMALRIVKRKNDSERKGHYPAVGRSANPDLDLVHQLRTWMRYNGIEIHPLCSASPGAQCKVCPPLFAKLANGPLACHVASTEPMTHQMVRDGVRRMAALCNGNPKNFSGISARKGGLTTAISAGVPEEIVFLQSGHGQTRAARAYMHLQDPARLFDTFRAFGL
jgi:integrase